MPNTLFLRLEGPLQSWGERARWSVRDSAPEPTKSGVVGLLSCALGLSDDDPIRALSQQLDVGVRCDRPGQRLVDYHTVSGGVMSAEGKVKINATTKERETVVSWRTYLCDASFLVALQVSSKNAALSGDALIARLADAVQAPHWPIFLGRKSCPPSLPVYDGMGEYADLLTALMSQPWLCNHPRGKGDPDTKRLRANIPATPLTGMLRRDEIDLRSHRTYLPRYSRDETVDVPIRYANNEEE